MRLQEILTEGSFEWDTEHDKNTFISLKGLVNKNNGVFKSIKQQQFVKNVTIAREPERDVAFAKSNYGVDVGEDENMIVVSAMTRHAAYGSRSLVPVFYGFVLDSTGIIRFYRIGVSGNLRDGAGPNAKKTKLEWTRPANVDASHLEKSEEEKKKEFKTKLGMSEGNYLGTEGERMKFELTLTAKKYLDTTQVAFNVSAEKWWNMYKDADGNVVYHTGKEGPEKGEKVVGAATVKKHLVSKRGDKVTVVIRPRFKLVEPVNEAKNSTKPQISISYKLRDQLGDYSNEIVYVEKGPRNKETQNEQYRVSFGPGAYDVDWIDTKMFRGATIVPTPKELIYKGL